MHRFVKLTYPGSLLRLNLLKNFMEGLQYLQFFFCDSSQVVIVYYFHFIYQHQLSSDLASFDLHAFMLMGSRVKVIVSFSSNDYFCLLVVMISLIQKIYENGEIESSK